MPDRRPTRGATRNDASRRFGLPARLADGDWLDARGAVDGEPPPLRTTVTVEHPRTVISRNASPDLPFDRSVNPYRGCEHGCVYCFARPSHAWHDLSPGLDFETRLFAKPGAAALLRAELARPGYTPAPLALGTNTDPYQPIEREWGITRALLAVLAGCGHPVAVTTKSDRVLRDLDLLAPMAARGLASVVMSVTSLDQRTAMTLEPRAPTPARRLLAVERLAAAGVPVGVALAPVVPHVTCHEVEALVARAAAAGATRAFCVPVRLPHEVAPLFRAWLDRHHPDRAGRVMATVRAMRGGRDDDPTFHSRLRGSGAWADLLHARFRLACRRHGLDAPRPALRCDLFRPPSPARTGDQGELF